MQLILIPVGLIVRVYVSTKLSFTAHVTRAIIIVWTARNQSIGPQSIYSVDYSVRQPSFVSRYSYEQKKNSRKLTIHTEVAIIRFVIIIRNSVDYTVINPSSI